MKKWNFVNHMKHVPLRNAFRLPAAAGVILNVIGIEIVISPGLPGLFPLYFACPPRRVFPL
jgi:hypothetical protein